MKKNLEGKCPICAKSFPHALLHRHVVAEPPAVRHRIMESIELQHPDWTHLDGVCQSCWEFHRQLCQPAGVSTNPLQPH